MHAACVLPRRRGEAAGITGITRLKFSLVGEGGTTSVLCPLFAVSWYVPPVVGAVVWKRPWLSTGAGGRVASVVLLVLTAGVVVVLPGVAAGLVVVVMFLRTRLSASAAAHE